jgi:hypothetical protein
MDKLPKIAAIILNTNRKFDTLECLASLEANHYPDLRVIVLDNSSTDGSNEAIKATFPHVEIIPILVNKGYAGNNNIGLKAALDQDPDWIFVLNEDIIFAENALRQLMDTAADLPEAGIIGPLVMHNSEPEIIQSAGGVLDKSWDSIHRAQNEVDRGQINRAGEVDWIHGCAIGVKREAILEAGLLDERFFYYWEETEWCLRIRSHGWKAYIIPQARIWHKGVQQNYQPSPNVTYYATRNRLLLLKLHHPPLVAWLLTCFFFIRTLIAWSVKDKWRDKRANRDAMWRGILDFFNQRWGIRQT